jgi:prepilin-type N-terminal cleavage/methylation domain-containing protein
MISPSKTFRKGKQRQGFTLVEIILASSIFAVVTLIGVTVFINVIRIQHRISLENAIYEDGRFMMERIAREIRQNTVDYEEYYRKVITPAQTYGKRYGCYASRFYNPEANGDLGAYCSMSSGSPSLPYFPYTKLVQNDPGCVVDKTTLDMNTGQNPYTGAFGSNNNIINANAFCDAYTYGGTCPPILPAPYEQGELYLINSKGTEKTFIAQKKVNTAPEEYALSLLRLKGEDADTDGLVEKWVNGPTYLCDPQFDCTGISATDPNLTLEKSLVSANAADLYKGFVPISPMRTNLTSLKFYVSPIEDPRKAFAETDPNDGIQQQPHVTIVMSLQPAASELTNFAGDTPTVTIQTTITSRVYNEVRSYMGKKCEDL